MDSTRKASTPSRDAVLPFSSPTRLRWRASRLRCCRRWHQRRHKRALKWTGVAEDIHRNDASNGPINFFRKYHRTHSTCRVFTQDSIQWFAIVDQLRLLSRYSPQYAVQMNLRTLHTQVQIRSSLMSVGKEYTERARMR